MKVVKVLTVCGEVLELKESELLKDSLGVFIKCPFKENGCNETCDVAIVKE